jgi:hypothetical protein
LATLIAGAVTAVFGAVLYWLSLSFPGTPSPSSDPGLLPGAVGLLLTLCGLGMVGTVLVRRAVAAKAGAADIDGETAAWQEGENDRTYPAMAIGFALLVGLAAWASVRLGFLTFTALLLAGAAVMLEPGRPTPSSAAKSAIVAVLITAAIHLIFTTGLRIQFPSTSLP